MKHWEACFRKRTVTGEMDDYFVPFSAPSKAAAIRIAKDIARINDWAFYYLEPRDYPPVEPESAFIDWRYHGGLLP